MNKAFVTSWLKVIGSAILVLVFIVFSALVASGFRFDLEFFKDWMFWAKTGINLVIMMIAYNAFKQLIIAFGRKQTNTNYGKVKAREQAFIKKIRNEHLEKVIDEKVIEENKRRHAATNQDLLDGVTHGLSEDDVLKDEFDFIEFCKKKKLKLLHRWKLKIAIYKILNGKAKYEKIDSNSILVDTTLTKKSDSRFAVMKFNKAQVEIKENIFKALSFLGSTAVINALVWNGINDSFWVNLLAQCVLITSSGLSGIMAGYFQINQITLILENRCDFLNRALEEHLIQKPLIIEAKALDNI